MIGWCPPVFSTCIEPKTFNMALCPYQEEFMNPENKRWKQRWFFLLSSLVTHGGGSRTSLIPSSGVCRVRSPDLQRGARMTVGSKLPLALMHLCFLRPGLIRQRWVTILSQGVDSNQQEVEVQLLQDGDKEDMSLSWVIHVGTSCTLLLNGDSDWTGGAILA